MKKKIGLLSMILLILYGCIILYFVLFSDRLGRVDGYSEYRYSLIPFQEINRFIQYRHYVSAGAFILNIIGNLVVFAPIGFLVPIWRGSGMRWYHIVAVSFLCSLLIETSQLVFRVGVFDVDDLIMNTTGGIIGYMAYLMLRRIIRRRASKGRKKN